MNPTQNPQTVPLQSNPNVVAQQFNYPLDYVSQQIINDQVKNYLATKILYIGKFTTLGGDANETITGLTGVTSSDVAIVSLQTKGAVPRTILTAIAGIDKVDMVFSGDPSTDHIICYVVLRI